MKTKFGAIIVDGRGKINGFVASKNRSGSYLRTKVTPVNPQSTRQMAVRAIMTTLSQGWRDLTAEQRNGWNAIVADWQSTDIFGDLKTPSGFNLYMKLNSNLLNGGGAAIAAAPTPAEILPLTDLGLTLDVSLGTVIWDFTVTPVPANVRYILESTGPIQPGISFVKNKWRQVKNLAPASATGVNITALYQAQFGVPVVDQNVQFRARALNLLTGQVSAWIYDDTTVVA